MHMNKYKIDLQFYKKVFFLALPIAMQSLITIGVNMLDNIMVGQLGENALSAVSLANTFISIYQIFCMGLGMGASVLVSRYWGMKSTDEANKAEYALKQTVSLMLRITLLFAALFAISTMIIPDIIMGTYTKETDIIRLGSVYFKYSIATYFFMGASMVSTIVLRSVGQVKLPLFVSIGAFFVNLCANYAFIFGNFGAPRMEVAGAAVGTLIARIFEFTFICGYLLFIDKRIIFRLHHLFMDTSTLIGEYIRICIPVLISDAILAFGNNAVAMVIGHLGAIFVAANAITSVTQQLSTVVIQGISQAGAIVTGQTLGMGDKEKTMSQGYRFMGLGLVLGLFSAVFIIIVSGKIIGAYSITAETAEVARQLMAAISIIIVFQATNSIMTKGVLRGGGDTRMLMLTDNIFLWTISIPLGIIAGFYLKLSAFWIYIFLKSDQVIKTIWCFFRLKSGKWIKNINTGIK